MYLLILREKEKFEFELELWFKNLDYLKFGI